MRIAVDVMGGDHGSSVVIAGVKQALHAPGNERIEELFLVGQQAEIKHALAAIHCSDRRATIIHASEVLTMDDKPVAALRKKKDCSMARAIELVRDGRAQAIISPGNTGGLVAASTLRLRQLEGVDRPAIATVMPSTRGHFILLDAGANPECKPMHLVQFAVMGHVYARDMLGVARPRVGILSNGTEDIKGNDLTRDALEICRKLDLNFLGYIEGHGLFNDEVDVVVTDGFVGNIVLKTCESMGKGILRILKRELTANPLRQMGATLAQGAFRSIKKTMDPEAHGGAPLLGLNGNVIKIHGSAKERVVANAIRQTVEAVAHNLNQHIRDEIARASARLSPAA
jgi:glycerol-3-phosphate acyltransferase PlsX